jgi:hypothetical protein
MKIFNLTAMFILTVIMSIVLAPVVIPCKIYDYMEEPQCHEVWN